MILPRIESVAADSNVLLAAVAGRAARRVFDKAPHLMVVTTDFTIAEVDEYLPEFGERYDIDVQLLREVLELLPVRRYGEAAYRSHMPAARRYLVDRDPDDIHLAALALSLHVPVWSNDKDLKVLPLPVYPTAQLLKVLGI